MILGIKNWSPSCADGLINSSSIPCKDNIYWRIKQWFLNLKVSVMDIAIKLQFYFCISQIKFLYFRPTSFYQTCSFLLYFFSIYIFFFKFYFQWYIGLCKYLLSVIISFEGYILQFHPLISPLPLPPRHRVDTKSLIKLC